MRKSRRWFRNVILPTAILLLLIGDMTGCIYVPWFEHRLDGGPNIRELIGDSSSGKRITAGKTSRQKVLGLLGAPQYRSADGKAIGYVTRNGIGSWVWLCGFAEPADVRAYVVRLQFDDCDRLLQIDWADSFAIYPPLSSLNVQPGGNPDNAVKRLNQSGPPLLPVH